jgi:hypothetical protein
VSGVALLNGAFEVSAGTDLTGFDSAFLTTILGVTDTVVELLADVWNYLIQKDSTKLQHKNKLGFHKL